jgi:NAD(P)-dependent dehydrogenase (short-subunit alcohol dehydrogenase family)
MQTLHWPCFAVGNGRVIGSVEGKTVVVTGAARGLGAAIARFLGAGGARLALLDLNDCAPVGDPLSALCLRCDVRERDQVEAAFDAVQARFGDIHGLVNNAGVYGEATTREEFRANFETNVWGAWLCADTAGRRMGPGGSIVNIGSHVVEHHGVTDELMFYAASKAALLNIQRSMSIVLGPRGIRVNTVAAGPIPLPDGFYGPQLIEVFDLIAPLGIAKGPEEVCAAVQFFLSDATRQTSGVHHAIDGAFIQGYSLTAFDMVLGRLTLKPQN